MTGAPVVPTAPAVVGRRPVRPQGSAQTLSPRRAAAGDRKQRDAAPHLRRGDAARRRTLSLRFSGRDTMHVTPLGSGVAPVVEGRRDGFPPGQPFHDPACPGLLGAAAGA